MAKFSVLTADAKGDHVHSDPFQILQIEGGKQL